MEDLDALLESHTCTGYCKRFSHSQTVLIWPADVATPKNELAVLVTMRDCLARHGFGTLEMDPTPRFDDADSEPKPWAVRYRVAPRAPGAGPAFAARSKDGPWWKFW